MLSTIFWVNVFLYIISSIYAKLTCGINKCSKHLVNKVVIVTGANAGIGFETAKDLAGRGAKVILACRNIGKGNEARDKIIKETGNKDVHVKVLDLASFKSVRAFADDILKNEKQLDILVNNAGMIGQEFKKTEDGLLMDMQSNHFGPFLLTSLLLPLLKSSGQSRIINVSSFFHFIGKLDFDNLNLENGEYGTWRAYSSTKLCNILMATELAKRLKGTEVTVNSLHPGAVRTNIFTGPWWSGILNFIVAPLYKDPWSGAQTSIYLAVAPELSTVTGKYFADCHMKTPSALSQDAELAEKLWHYSEKITKLK